MKRREFITLLGGAAASWPLAARAQQRERVRRIAWLGAGRADEPSPYLESLRAGLRDAGWSEGRNLTIAPFWATGLDNVEAVARELLASDPEVIVAQEFTVLGLRSLKVTKPVVFGFSGDPLDVQLVQSWARPGGNFTGMSYLAIELVGIASSSSRSGCHKRGGSRCSRGRSIPASPSSGRLRRRRPPNSGSSCRISPIRRAFFRPATSATSRRHSARSLRSVATRWWSFPIPPCTRSASTLPASPWKRSCPRCPAGRPLPTRDCW